MRGKNVTLCVRLYMKEKNGDSFFRILSFLESSDCDGICSGIPYHTFTSP